MNIDLSQDELKVLVALLSQVQLRYNDSLSVNQIIAKLDSYIEKPKPIDIPKQPVEGEIVT